MTEFEKLLYEEVKGIRKDLKSHIKDDHQFEKRVSNE
jgi:hypothetical protein|tara:strand:- start:8618 stop:8728 length:111 start_codon:yes stop_codon:yes gene_type:complete